MTFFPCYSKSNFFIIQSAQTETLYNVEYVQMCFIKGIPLSLHKKQFDEFTLLGQSIISESQSKCVKAECLLLNLETTE